MRKIICGAAIFLLAACQVPMTESQKANEYEKGAEIVIHYTGQGACLDCFNFYRHQDLNKAFYLSPTGAFHFAVEKATLAEAQAEASSGCQLKNGNEPCKALMMNDRFVWVE